MIILNYSKLKRNEENINIKMRLKMHLHLFNYKLNNESGIINWYETNDHSKRKMIVFSSLCLNGERLIGLSIFLVNSHLFICQHAKCLISPNPLSLIFLQMLTSRFYFSTHHLFKCQYAKCLLRLLNLVVLSISSSLDFLRYFYALGLPRFGQDFSLSLINFFLQ